MGLRWDRGYCTQTIDATGKPHDEFPKYDYSFLEDTGVRVRVRVAEDEVPCRVWHTQKFGHVPLYLLESPLLEIHPHVPIVGQLGLGIALFSYHGTLSWGFTADWDLVPDLHDLVIAVDGGEGVNHGAQHERQALASLSLGGHGRFVSRAGEDLASLAQMRSSRP